MNVGTRTKSAHCAQFHFWEYLFRIFGTVSLQCRVDTGYSSATGWTAYFSTAGCTVLDFSVPVIFLHLYSILYTVRWNTGWDLIGVRKNQLAAYLLLQAYHNGGGGGWGGGPPGTSFSGASISSTPNRDYTITSEPMNTFVEPQHCELSIILYI